MVFCCTNVFIILYLLVNMNWLKGSRNKFIVFIIILLICFIMFFSYFDKNNSQNDLEDFDELSQQWIGEALKLNPINDTRADDDKLRPVVSYDVEIIQVSKYYNNDGEGWQLVGSVNDIIVSDDSKYILFGKNNERYRKGIWNNVLDEESSFQEYVVIERKENVSKVVIKESLVSTTSQILMGLRLMDDGVGFEVVQNSPTGHVQVINSYLFD